MVSPLSRFGGLSFALLVCNLNSGVSYDQALFISVLIFIPALNAVRISSLVRFVMFLALRKYSSLVSSCGIGDGIGVVELPSVIVVPECVLNVLISPCASSCLSAVLVDCRDIPVAPESFLSDVLWLSVLMRYSSRCEA